MQHQPTRFVVCASLALLIGQSDLARAGDDDVVECRDLKAWSPRASYRRGDTVTTWVPGYSRATPVRGKYQCDADGCDDETWAGGAPKAPGDSSQWKRVGLCRESFKYRSDREGKREGAKDAPRDASNDSSKDASPPVKAGGGPLRAKQSEALMPKHAEEIKTYCSNESLTFRIDWPAFEALDFETIARTQCDRTSGDKLHEVLLTGEHNSDMCGGAVATNANHLVRPFQTVCRDHADYRPRAAKIRTIVLAPMQYKFLNDKDAIAYARKTNDYTVLKRADKKEQDDDPRRDYRKLSLSGATLVVRVPITFQRGDEDEITAQLLKILDQ